METKHSNYNHYTKEEIRIIKTYYPKYGATGPKGVCARIEAKCATIRSSRAITLQAIKLGVSYQGKRKGAFVKGFTPHNKGVKMPEETKKKVCKDLVQEKQNTTQCQSKLDHHKKMERKQVKES